MAIQCKLYIFFPFDNSLTTINILFDLIYFTQEVEEEMNIGDNEVEFTTEYEVPDGTMEQEEEGEEGQEAESDGTVEQEEEGEEGQKTENDGTKEQEEEGEEGQEMENDGTMEQEEEGEEAENN
jgi:hypothetical protein